jgi:type IV pilus assembly protein PilB
MLNVNSRVRRMIANGASRPDIEEELKKPENGFVSLRENAMRLVKEGITTSSELLRVVSEDD